MGSSITEADIFENKQDLLISPTGGIPCRKIAHFLKPTVSSPQDSKLKQPFIPSKCIWPLDVAFNGWLEPLKNWSKWVDAMHSKYSDLWKRAGILEAVLASKYSFHRVDDLFFGVAERWNCDTNTLVFPWGETTITLEDMMILGGFSVLGVPVFQPVENTYLANICNELSNVLIKRRMQTHYQWLDYFRNRGEKYEHEAFLSLWLSRFVFPGTEYDRVGDEVIPIAVSLAKGTKFALAPAVLATIYRDMSVLKVSMDASSIMETEEGEGHILAVSLWAPLYLVQLWVWERFIHFRPEPNPLNKDEPRVARWHDLTRLDIGNVRPIIGSSGELFLWRPYCLHVNNWPFPMFYKEKKECISIGLGQYLDDELESFVKCLRVCFLVGVDCGEPYYPHRVAMQFGFDQDIPGWIPRSKSSVEVAWYDYSRPFGIATKLELPPRLAESDVSTRYLDWWRKYVLLLPVESFQGLVRKKRSCRQTMKHTPNSKKVRMDYSVTKEGFGFKPACAERAEYEQSPVSSGNLIAAAELVVPPGFLPKANVMPGSTQISNSKLENGRKEPPAKHKVKIEAAELDVPPGFLPKSNVMPGSKQISNSKLENGRKEPPAKHNVKIAAAELDAPPGFLPKADVMPGSTQISNSKLEHGRKEPPVKHKMKIASAELDVPPGILPKSNVMPGSTQISNSKLENGRMEPPAKHKVKIASAELDVPPGFLPKSNVMPGSTQISNSKLEHERKEPPAKHKIKIASAELDVPPGILPKAAAELDVPPGFLSKPNVMPGSTLISNSKLENGRKEPPTKHKIMIAAAELDVPPGILPNSNVMPGIKQISNSKLEKGRKEPPAPGKHKMKIAADELDVPPGFLPNANVIQGSSNSNLENGRMETSTKIKVKIEPADLAVPPGFPPKVEHSQLQMSENEEQSNRRNVGNDVEDISDSHSEAMLRCSTSTVAASGILQPSLNSSSEFGPDNVNELEARLGRIERLLIKISNQKTKAVMK